MAPKNQNKWSTDLLIAGVGLAVGILIGLMWSGIPSASTGTSIVSSVMLAALFMTAHRTNDPTTAYVGHVGQAIVAVSEGVLLMMLVHP